MKNLPSRAFVSGAALIALGVLLTALGALWFSEIFNNVWNCIHSSVPIPCGLDPRTYLDFGAYPLVAIGLVLIVAGLALIVYSSLTPQGPQTVSALSLNQTVKGMGKIR